MQALKDMPLFSRRERTIPLAAAVLGLALLLLSASALMGRSPTGASDAARAAAQPGGTPFAGLSRLGLQEYSSGAAYTAEELQQLQLLHQAGVGVVRYGTGIWAYVPGGPGRITTGPRVVDSVMDRQRISAL